ncbi:MAG: M23 family metallopeptidase [Sulfuricurvum sp.]|uniref:M23 family metallopeptidase n=1 Tax=Sulfuricurvum sp. TaxID=2025608 RepID=UPI00356896B6
MRFWIVCFISIVALWGAEGYNGKSLILTLPSPSGVVVTADKNISVLSHPLDKMKGIAIIPIDYYAPESEQNLTWIAPGQEMNITLDIHSATYPTEVLNVDPSKVTPPPEVLERIELERTQAYAIYNHFTPIRYWNKPFIRPIDSITTSAYGSARTYNDTLKSYHGGIDFRALTPTPIQAANDGIVVLAQERYYSGGTIIIDHGEGLYSCYFHLSRFDVKVGDYVTQGQAIALSGASGRITGPHLHFGIMVHGVQTDPLDLMEQIDHLFVTQKEQ